MDHRFCSSALSHLLLTFGIAITSATCIAPVQAREEPCGSPTVDYPFPYTDVASVGTAFCPGIMEAYVTGITKGTSASTFSPNDTVIRSEMTTFLQRSLDQGLARSSRRTVLKQLWQVNNGPLGPQTITVNGFPVFCAADGEDIWVAAEGEVDQVQASTGRVLGTVTAAVGTKLWPIAAIPGRIISADNASAIQNLYFINPTVLPLVFDVYVPGAGFPSGASSIAYDGTNFWIANFSGSVTIATANPYSSGTINNYSAGFSKPVGLVYDGKQMRVTDHGAGTLLPVASDGTIGTAVTVGAGPQQPAFDGENIWVPNSGDNSITVVQASTGTMVATIAGDEINMLSGPEQASFDGERMLVTNPLGDSVTIFKAADLSVIANIPTGAGSNPYGACSDGINFWVTLHGTHNLLRF